MKDLDQLDLVALDANELQKVQGGAWVAFAVAVAALVGGIILNNWDEFEKGVSDGWNKANPNPTAPKPDGGAHVNPTGAIPDGGVK